jgi:hypothetical protein
MRIQSGAIGKSVAYLPTATELGPAAVQRELSPEYL